LIYTNQGDATNAIVTVQNCLENGFLPNCDHWTGGDCYAVDHLDLCYEDKGLSAHLIPFESNALLQNDGWTVVGIDSNDKDLGFWAGFDKIGYIEYTFKSSGTVYFKIDNTYTGGFVIVSWNGQEIQKIGSSKFIIPWLNAVHALGHYPTLDFSVGAIQQSRDFSIGDTIRIREDFAIIKVHQFYIVC